MATNFLTRSRHKSIYYFRRRIPIDLKNQFSNDLILKSLNTPCRKIAVILARNLASQTDQLFGRIRVMKNNNGSDLLNYTLNIKFDNSEVTLNAEPHETESILPLIDRLIALDGGKNISAIPSTTASSSTKSFQTYIDEYFSKAELKPTTIVNYKSKLNLAKEYFGESFDLLNVKQIDIVKIADHVKIQIINPTTQGLYIQIIVTFFNWHLARHGLPQLNSRTLIPTRKTPEHHDREEFSLDDMRELLKNAFKYSRNEPYKWWSTVAVAFMGCRIEEICQVNLDTDLIHDTKQNIWYLNFDEKPDSDGITRKSLKKLTSWRRVPIHSVLIKYGFIEYLKSHKKQDARPFENGWNPRTIAKDNIFKWSQYATKWGGRELTKLMEMGLIEHSDKTYFHSMRHTIARLMQDAGILSEISEALAGRTSGAGEQQRYSKIKDNHELLSREGIEKALNPLVEIFESVVKNK